MSVDPADECTFWYTNQYIPADGVYNWRTRIFSFQLPGCVTSPDYAVWPASGGSAIGRGRAAAIALDSAALLPSAGSKILSLSVAELPAGVTARIDPASVAPGQPATLTLTAAADAQTGRGQGYLIRATAGGATATAAGALDVVDADFAMKPDRIQASVAEGGSTRVRIDTRQLFGTPETITLSASSPPSAAEGRPLRSAAGSRIRAGIPICRALTGLSDLPTLIGCQSCSPLPRPPRTWGISSRCGASRRSSSC